MLNSPNPPGVRVVFGDAGRDMSDERTATRDEIPASIGRYQITGALGFGAMGAVYKAFDPLIKRTLAIKTIRLDIPRNSPQHRAFIERFYQEARISGTLSHPNIVTLFDIGEENGLPFLAMEFVDGKTIAAVIDEGIRFKPERVIALVSQVAAALDYAHSRGVVHRDIKPSNLILSDGDKVKVTDFGIAKLVDSEITHSGALLGTPSYMSPEQAMGEKLDGRSDIFSLGVCAFEMLSGQQPFPGANVTSILYKLVHVEPVEPPDLEMNGLVPQKWREVFSKVLAKKPSSRYQTASAFVEDLEYCLGSWFTGIGGDAVVAAGGRAPVGIEPTVTVQRPALPQDDLPITSELETLVRTPPEGIRAVPGPAEAVGLVPVEPGEVPTIRLPPRPTSPPAGPIDATLVFGEPPPSPTVLLSAEATTTQVPPSLPESPAEAASTRPPEPAVAEPLPPRPGLPVGAVVGGVAALLLVAAGIVGWALWQRSRVPAPEAAAVPTATAPEPAATAASAGRPHRSRGRYAAHPERTRGRARAGRRRGEGPDPARPRRPAAREPRGPLRAEGLRAAGAHGRAQRGGAERGGEGEPGARDADHGHGRHPVDARGRDRLRRRQAGRPHSALGGGAQAGRASRRGFPRGPRALVGDGGRRRRPEGPRRGAPQADAGGDARADAGAGRHRARLQPGRRRHASPSGARASRPRTPARARPSSGPATACR